MKRKKNNKKCNNISVFGCFTVHFVEREMHNHYIERKVKFANFDAFEAEIMKKVKQQTYLKSV